METIKDFDIFLLKFINGNHHPWLDSLMVTVSAKWVWLPLYGFLLFLIIKHDGKSGVKTIIVAIILIALSDQTASAIFKPYFARPRPCHESNLTGLIRTPVGCGGKYGFISSHAANTCAAAMFLTLYLRKSFSKIWLLFIWAFANMYSRVYLGVHYPTDVVGGGIVGSAYGALGYLINVRWHKKNLDK